MKDKKVKLNYEVPSMIDSVFEISRDGGKTWIAPDGGPITNFRFSAKPKVVGGNMNDKLSEAKKRIETAIMKIGRGDGIGSMEELEKVKNIIEDTKKCVLVFNEKYAFIKPQIHNGITMEGWEQLAKLGALVDVSKDGKCWEHHYLKTITDADEFECWEGGRTSETAITRINNGTIWWPHCRLIESDQLFLNPGYQPVPDNVIVGAFLRNDRAMKDYASKFIWRKHNDAGTDIFAFRILGVEE